MELDARWIQRSDFSQARRGYDPDEVDEHLREIADAVEELRAATASQPSSGAATLAGAAAEQVRAIVQAAEGSAADIEGSARAEAERAVADARREAAQQREGAAADAARTREEARAEAGKHVDKVQQAVGGIAQHADGLDSQLTGLVDELKDAILVLAEKVRTSSGGIERELLEIKGGITDLRVDEPEAVAADEPELAEEVDDEAGYADEAEQEVDDILSEDTVEYSAVSGGEVDDDEDTEESAADEPAEDRSETRVTSGEGAEGARLIALNMALNGAPREETARYLEENFDLDDSASILEDVYARVSG